MKIGLLEDNLEIGECLSVVLELSGHQVYRYMSGNTLLDTLSADAEAVGLLYDLLIVDLNLPGEISGQEVVARIHSITSLRKLPIIIISGAHEWELEQVKTRFPSIPIFRKPFKLQYLTHFIDEYCTVS